MNHLPRGGIFRRSGGEKDKANITSELMAKTRNQSL